MYYDFSNYKLSNIRYGGSERKLEILINSLDISTIHKNFYTSIIMERYKKILKHSYDKLVGNN